MIKTEGEAMQRVRNLVAINGELREILIHEPEFRLCDCNGNDVKAAESHIIAPDFTTVAFDTSTSWPVTIS